MNDQDLSKLTRSSMWGKITIRSLSDAEAAKVVTWWQLGLPAVHFEAFSLDDTNDHFLPTKTVYGTGLLNDGQYSVWSAAGYVSHREKSADQGLAWCKEYLDKTIRELSYCPKDLVSDWHEQCDFDQVLYTGIELLGKADRTEGVVLNFFRALPLSKEDYDTILWVCRAYYKLAFTIVEANREKVRKVANLFHKEGLILQSEVKKLFKGWGEPKDVGLTLEDLEKELGACPVKGIDRSTFDLMTYSVWDFPGYSPTVKD